MQVLLHMDNCERNEIVPQALDVYGSWGSGNIRLGQGLVKTWAASLNVKMDISGNKV